MNGACAAHTLLPVARCTLTAMATVPRGEIGRQVDSNDRHLKHTGANGKRYV